MWREVRPKIQEHLASYAEQNGIILDRINVQPDHVHALIYLQSNQQIDQILKLLKGESSHWVNENNLVRGRFSWQRGYGAFSVGPSYLVAVRQYIDKQDEHHRIRTFAEEHDEILRRYGFDPVRETDESVSG